METLKVNEDLCSKTEINIHMINSLNYWKTPPLVS